MLWHHSCSLRRDLNNRFSFSQALLIYLVFSVSFYHIILKCSRFGMPHYSHPHTAFIDMFRYISKMWFLMNPHPHPPLPPHPHPCVLSLVSNKNIQKRRFPEENQQIVSTCWCSSGDSPLNHSTQPLREVSQPWHSTWTAAHPQLAAEGETLSFFQHMVSYI